MHYSNRTGRRKHVLPRRLVLFPTLVILLVALLLVWSGIAAAQDGGSIVVQACVDQNADGI